MGLRKSERARYLDSDEIKSLFAALDLPPAAASASARTDAVRAAGVPSPPVGRPAEPVSGAVRPTPATRPAGAFHQLVSPQLAEELFHWARQQGITAAHTRSYAAEGRLSLAPVTDWLRSDALRLHFASLDKLWLSEVARLLPELLTERTDLARPEPIREYGARQRFFEALARAVLAAPRPTLLWIDDLQWCDPETFEWLHFFLRFEPHSPILILGTARSDESAPDHPLAGLARQLRSEGRLSLIELSPLDAAETAKLATRSTLSKAGRSTGRTSTLPAPCCRAVTATAGRKAAFSCGLTWRRMAEAKRR